MAAERRQRSCFFIEVKAYRSPQSTREPEPIVIAAYGVKDLAPAAAAAPELPLLRHRFPDTRPALAMGVLAQEEGPIDLIIARDYRRHWPVPISSSCFDTDKLFLMKTTFHPGQFLYGPADPDAVGTKMKGSRGSSPWERGSQQDLQHHRPGNPGRRRRRRARRRGGGVSRLRQSGG
jgi:hypothetical protein